GLLRLLVRSRVSVDRCAWTGTTPVSPPTLFGGAGGRAATLSHAPLVEHFHIGPGERLTEGAVETPLVVLNDEDPSSARPCRRLRVTRRVGVAIIHRAEPTRDGYRAVLVTPRAGRLLGQAVAVQAQPRLSE